jgi:hypothetical protein
MAKVAFPIATTVAGVHAYTKIKEVGVELEELGQRHNEVAAGRALFPHEGQRPFDDDVFVTRMQDFLNSRTPYISELVYAWTYHCMVHTCQLSFNAAAQREALWLLPGECCMENKKVIYADKVLGVHKEACHAAWLSNCNKAVLYFEQPQIIENERIRVQRHESYYNAQLYAAIALSSLYAGFMLKSWLWKKA